MSFSEALFREHFPEFSDTTKYTSGMLSFWAEVADIRMNEDRWGDLYDHGMELFVAHNISLQQQSVATATAGGTPGTGIGMQTSQSVGPISESIDTGSIAIQGAGDYNLTLYGIQFKRLSDVVGIGGFVSI